MLFHATTIHLCSTFFLPAILLILPPPSLSRKTNIYLSFLSDLKNHLLFESLLCHHLLLRTDHLSPSHSCIDFYHSALIDVFVFKSICFPVIIHKIVIVFPSFIHPKTNIFIHKPFVSTVLTIRNTKISNIDSLLQRSICREMGRDKHTHTV